MSTVDKLFDKETDKLERLEKEAARRATAPLRKPLAAMLAALKAFWPGDDASRPAKQAALRRVNSDRVLMALPQVERELMVAALRALAQGISQANGQTGLRVARPTRIPDSLTEDVRAVGVAMHKQHVAARRLLGQAQTQQQAEAAVVLLSNVNKASSNARWIANRAANEGIAQVARSDKSLVLIWRAERDGCLHCLGYQGAVQSRGVFKPVNDFAGKPLKLKRKLTMPPLHPNCRCSLWSVSADVVGPVVLALVREAKRSVLRGFSLPTESEPARLRAASKLLAKGSGLPNSVKQYARRSIKLGGFKRGRSFPGAR